MSAPLVVSPVVAAINVAFEAVLVGDLADVVMIDVTDDEQEYAQRSVTVGGTWDPDIENWTAEQTIRTQVTERGAARRLEETTAVDCAVFSGDGDRVFGDHRQSVGQIVSALRGSLRAVTSIGGAAARLQVTDEAWMQGGDDQGSGAVVLFTVTATRLL